MFKADLFPNVPLKSKQLLLGKVEFVHMTKGGLRSAETLQSTNTPTPDQCF